MPERTTDHNKCQPNNVRQTINASGDWASGQGGRRCPRWIEGDRLPRRVARAPACVGRLGGKGFNWHAPATTFWWMPFAAAKVESFWLPPTSPKSSTPL
jgi:hypothetical protein